MNRLKELRKSRRLTQKDFAKQFNISQSGYARWESGKVKIDRNSLNSLAEFYNVSVDYILGEEQSKSILSGNMLIIIKDNGEKEVIELTNKDKDFLNMFLINYVKGNKSSK